MTRKQGGEQKGRESAISRIRMGIRKREGGLSAFSIALSPITVHKDEMRLDHEHKHKEENL